MQAIEIRRPTTIEMYRPAERRSTETNLQMARLLSDIVGRGRLRFCKGIRGELSDELAGVINNYVLASVKQRYSLPEESDVQEFYMQQQKLAIAVPEYYGELVPEITKDVELKDEISMLSDRPSDLVRLIFRHPEDIDPTLAYEVQRHILISDLAGQINARTKNGRLRTVLSDVHRLLNERLFEGPEGAGQRIISESFHDDETNQVIGFPDRCTRKPPTAHLKRVPLVVRKIPEVGLVHTSLRKKDDRVAIVKSLAKALGNGGVININGDIQDSIGMIFASMEDHITPAQLADLVVSIIQSGPRKVAKIEPDDQTDNDHGQSSAMSFNARRKIWFEDIPTPLEFIFYDRETFLNSRLEVGTRDPETGFYMGRAHSLFEPRRARPTVDVIFPKEIYPTDFDTPFVNRSRQIAQELREMYKVA